jgi:N-succinyldiaminopimelate aminotransferase
MNTELQLLHPYPFEKLAELKKGIIPPAHLAHISLSIGEPKHSPPAFVLQTLTEQLSGLSQYPITKGLPELREAMAHWAQRRFSLTPNSLTAEQHILPVAGTREALFSFTQVCVNRTQKNSEATKPLVVMPNPFYQIYEGAALLAGATPYFLNCMASNGFNPDFSQVPDSVWRACQLLFICSPGNPTGAVLNRETLCQLIELADKHDFIIASDECYSELYFDENSPPLGLLQVCAEMGRHDFKRCVVFHSLSKRSNLPGLRSGFVAGDADILKPYLLYRTYQGCALPVPTQMASISAWQDEHHVQANRELYRQKFAAVCEILGPVLNVKYPDASFYLWPETPIDDREFARLLFAQQNVTVLPGQFLARETSAGNPGQNRVRLALVASLAECCEAAQRIKQFVANLT